MFKLHEGRPNGIDLIVNGQIQMLINTPIGKHAQIDDYRLRQAAIARRLAYTTTLSAANAACDAILSLRSRPESGARAAGMARGDREPAGDGAAGRGGAGVSVATGTPSLVDPTAVVHPSAFVDAGARIGAETRVWHFCHVNPGAVIGARCSLGQNVVVMNGVRIGDNVKIQNNVSIYEGVELEDDVFCGPSMVFTNVSTPAATSRARTSTEPRAYAAAAPSAPMRRSCAA